MLDFPHRFSCFLVSNTQGTFETTFTSVYKSMEPWKLFGILLCCDVMVAMAATGAHAPCPRPAVGTCTCVQTGSYTNVKCLGLDEFPLDVPINTTSLTINNGAIRFVPRDYLQQFKYLQTLDLQNNKISNGFRLPDNMWNINLASNQLKSLDLWGMMDNLHRLKALYLDYNPLKTIKPLTFANLSSLMNLHILGCKLEDIREGTFQGLRSLGKLDLRENKIRVLRKGVFKGIVGNEFQRLAITLQLNSISKIEKGVFEDVAGITKLDLSVNKLVSFPDLQGLAENVENLNLHSNLIYDLTQLGSMRVKTITQLDLSYNKIRTITSKTFNAVNIRRTLNLANNEITSIPEGFLENSPRLNELFLHQNKIQHIHQHAFRGMNNLQGLYLFKNKIKSLYDETFSGLVLSNLFLHSNIFVNLTGTPFKGIKNAAANVYLFANGVAHMSNDFLSGLAKKASVAVDCKTLLDLPHLGIESPQIVCAPYHLSWVVGQRHEVAMALRKSGFRCEMRYVDDWDCILCSAGTYGDEEKENCVTCSAGGFYQDDMGQSKCKECNMGTFVHPNNTPATSPTSCQACPQGTNSGDKAMYRACSCLPNFYRLDRFGRCSPCPDKSLKCEDDYAILVSGYYWKWTNQSKRVQYDSFILNLLVKNSTFQTGVTAFSGSLPARFKCPRDSCLGGLDSTCKEGYQGPLCAICKSDYFDRMNRCIHCPSKLRASFQILGVTVAFVLVLLAVLWGDKKKIDHSRRTVADVILSCFKIVVGFYQVMAGMYSAFTNIQWPSSVVWMQKTLHYIQLNILEIAPISCLTEILAFDALQQFALVLSINVIVVALFLVYLGLRIRVIQKKSAWDQAKKYENVAGTKSSCIRNICVFLFATYPTTCTKIIQILPPNCVQLCFESTHAHCTSFLRSDYSVQCHTHAYNIYWRVAAGWLVYPIGFPMVILILVWKYIRQPQVNRGQNNQGTEQDSLNDPQELGQLIANERVRANAICYAQPRAEPSVRSGLTLFYENYKPECWYWEAVEMGRKLILTSGLALIGEHSRTQVGLGAIISALFAIMYVYLRPIADQFENILQTIALMAIFLNLSIGVLLKTPDDEVSAVINHQNDDVGVSVMLIFINTAVIGIVVVACLRIIIKHVYRWCKTEDRPGCADCWRICLSLVLPCRLGSNHTSRDYQYNISLLDDARTREC
ncbi:uncharacterized protein LOC5518949 isoform X1 [Nematostella vectensis]|uniref:uncharacterized protein LOC5518949 isoform X1 n=2 Tax=Nematostella vectensis TaxID=45351 RepID=UPI002077233C|nr:uncharacterized protein LOC5518949 isoform X1 [Nematostella vectensis]